MNNGETKDQVIASLAHLGVLARPMFGGYGLYLGERYFGIVAEGQIWFRTDPASRPDYISRGMPAFQPANRPRGPKTVDRNFRVPDDIVANPLQFGDWALRAAAAERR